MADQNSLTIDGIGGDPSGSHPIGSLNVNWSESIDDTSIKYTANTIISDPGETLADATDTYYSEVLCVGPLIAGMRLDVGDTGDAQITCCWQWYNPATSGVNADFSMSADGKSGTFGNGTWTDIGVAYQNYYISCTISSSPTHALLMAKGAMLRVKMVVTDAGSDGVSEALVTAGVAAVNAAYCSVPIGKQLYNQPLVAAYSGQGVSGSIGGIGADPS